MNRNHQHLVPCLHCHPHSYIRMVQHLIERCLLLQMSRDQCVKVLSQHASIQPLVTLTVWRELTKRIETFFNNISGPLILQGLPPVSMCNRSKIQKMDTNM